MKALFWFLLGALGIGLLKRSMWIASGAYVEYEVNHFLTLMVGN